MDFKIRIFAKNQVAQALLGYLDSWSKFTSKLTIVESHYLSNFGFSNEEMDSKIGIYLKNWARQVWLENFDFWSTSTQKLAILESNHLCNFRVSNKGMQKIEQDMSFLNILNFGQDL